jgi:hypothetical protein
MNRGKASGANKQIADRDSINGIDGVGAVSGTPMRRTARHIFSSIRIGNRWRHRSSFYTRAPSVAGSRGDT